MVYDPYGSGQFGLSAMLLDGRLGPGQHVTVAAEGDALDFRVSDRKPDEPVPAG